MTNPPTLTVAQLIEKLQSLPQDHMVYIHGDPAEGDTGFRVVDATDWDGCCSICAPGVLDPEYDELADKYADPGAAEGNP